MKNVKQTLSNEPKIEAPHLDGSVRLELQCQRTFVEVELGAGSHIAGQTKIFTIVEFQVQTIEFPKIRLVKMRP